MAVVDVDKKILSIWKDIVKRTTAGSYAQSKLNTYVGCTLDERFKSYQYFNEWYKRQIGFDLMYEVDKDLLVKGNKHYSPELCTLLPKIINGTLCNSKRARGDLPVGVTLHGQNDMYVARCRYVEDGERKRKTIGYYKTPEDAFQGYKAFKEAYLKRLADYYRDTISAEAYEALQNYTIEEDD